MKNTGKYVKIYMEDEVKKIESVEDFIFCIMKLHSISLLSDKKKMFDIERDDNVTLIIGLGYLEGIFCEYLNDDNLPHFTSINKNKQNSKSLVTYYCMGHYTETKLCYLINVDLVKDFLINFFNQNLINFNDEHWINSSLT